VKILLFGATGSAGGSVLRACLAATPVTEVRAITRRPVSLDHAKLRNIVHDDYLNFARVEGAFVDVDACLFCLGISVTQVSADEYRRITHDFTIAAARAVRDHSAGSAFHYITGRGTATDSRFVWARVKAQTERELIDLVQADCWRPAAIDGMPSASEPRVIRTLRPFYRLLRPFRSLYIAGEDLGRAMLQATAENMRGRIIENAEIRDLADRATAFRTKG
jgi:uncharacterized protein YbjT (DUF2867 family)